MIDSHRRALLTFILAVGICAAGAVGQAPPKNISQNVKAAAALTPGDVNVVDAFVAAYFKLLSDPNTDIQKNSRDALVTESKGSGVTADYVLKYATAVNREATNLLPKEKGVRPRLAMAIVVARVAENTSGTALVPAVVLLLKDQSPALQLWGMRGARMLMKELIKVGGKPQSDVLDLVFPVAKKNGTGPVTDEAYDALIAADAAGYDPLLDLADHRLSLYQKGTPEDPVLEAKPWGQLGSAGTWVKLTPAQQMRAMEGMCTTLNVAAKRGDEADGVLEEQLRVVVSKTAANMFVVVDSLKLPQAQREALQLMLKQIASGAPGQNYQLVPNTQPVCPEIRKIPPFDKMKQQATIE